MTLEPTAHGDPHPFPHEGEGFPKFAFLDALRSNAAFAETFAPVQRGGVAAKGLAIVTCMDSRIDPLKIVGMDKGDAKILRNAGARVTEDVIRTLTLATYLLGVNRVLIMPHTDCKMASATETEIHKTIWDQFGVDTRSLAISTVDDQMAGLQTDVMRLRAFPLLPTGVVVGGAVYNVHTGRLEVADI